MDAAISNQDQDYGVKRTLTPATCLYYYYYLFLLKGLACNACLGNTPHAWRILNLTIVWPINDTHFFHKEM